MGFRVRPTVSGNGITTEKERKRREKCLHLKGQYGKLSGHSARGRIFRRVLFMEKWAQKMSPPEVKTNN